MWWPCISNGQSRVYTKRQNRFSLSLSRVSDTKKNKRRIMMNENGQYRVVGMKKIKGALIQISIVTSNVM